MKTPHIPAARDAWFTALRSLAPSCEDSTAWTLAALLAGRASPDALLIVSDALREAAAEMTIRGRMRSAGDLLAIAGALDTEAARRAGEPDSSG